MLKKITVTPEKLNEILLEKGQNKIIWAEPTTVEKIIFLERKEDKPFIRGHRKPKLNEIEQDKVKRMKEAGMSNCAIAREFGVSEGTIRNILKHITYLEQMY